MLVIYKKKTKRVKKQEELLAPAFGSDEKGDAAHIAVYSAKREGHEFRKDNEVLNGCCT